MGSTYTLFSFIPIKARSCNVLLGILHRKNFAAKFQSIKPLIPIYYSEIYQKKNCIEL